MKPFLALGTALAACIVAVAPAFACIGQIKVSLGSAEPGSPIQVRGYGFWADPRPVTFTWDDGATVTTVQPDASGVFSITLQVPEREGSYRLVATQGENDPEPAYNIVRVVRAGPVIDTTSAVGPATAPAEPAALAVDAPPVVAAAESVVQVAPTPQPAVNVGLLLAAVIGGAVAVLGWLGVRSGMTSSPPAASRPR